MSDREQLLELSSRFWSWRAGQQPRSGDDIPRIERPAGWVPRWSKDDVQRYREEIAAFESALARVFTFDEIDHQVARSEWVDKVLLRLSL